MSDANAERGEHELELGGIPYRLRPSHQAIVTIEKRTERSLLELTGLASRGALTLSTVGIIAAELIRAGADEGDTMTRGVNAEKISELVYAEGVHRVMSRLTLCLVDAASGGRTASGEAKAAPAPISEDAGAA